MLKVLTIFKSTINRFFLTKNTFIKFSAKHELTLDYSGLEEIFCLLASSF